MSVTTYTIGCGYELLKLKDTVFFLSKTQLKTINIDNGEAYATFVNQSPQPPSPNRLKGFNVKLTETESLDERYKFTKQLTMSIHGHLTDSTFLLDDDYYIVVQTEDGTYYLVNVDFPSKMTYTYNLSEGQNQTDFTFTSNSNHPTLKLNWSPTTWNTCQTYQVYGINSLKLLEKDYTTIDAEQGVINLFDEHEFKDVDFLKNTISLQEAYDGEITTTTISFEIPFNNYKPSWQYNLLEFDQNLYVAHITSKNSESGIFAGYEHGLQPSYEINGSTSDGESATIKITLVEASNWGVFEFDTWSYYRDSTKRWVGIDSEVKCIDLGVGINTLMQEVDGNGTPLGRYKCLEGYESVYTNYNIVGTYTEDEVESFRTSRCTVFRARGGAASTLYTCIDGNKYILLCSQVSYDGGKHWIDGDVYELGEMVESASTWCDLPAETEWRETDEFICGDVPPTPTQYRWTQSGWTCVGYDKYQNNIKEQSTDGGTTWTVVTPVEYSASTLIEANSQDCGYVPPTPTQYRWTQSGTTCVGYDKYQNNIKEQSTDGGSTWTVVIPEEYSASTLIEANSQDCGYVPPTPASPKFTLTLNNSTTVTAECGSSSVITENEISAYTGSVVSVVIGDCVTSIGDSAFRWCSSLSSVTIGSGVTIIDKIAFGECTSLTSVTIGSGVTEIEEYAFYECENLENITFPNSLTTIGDYCFDNCYSLDNVEIPSGVTYLGEASFDTCVNLQSITFHPINPPTMPDAWVFENCESLNYIYVPTQSVDAYKAALSPYSSIIYPIPT